MEGLFRSNVLIATLWFLSLFYTGNCKILNYGEPCIDSKDGISDCNPALGLKCTDVEGKALCTCDPQISNDNPLTRRCEGLVSKPCISNTCVQNAKCNHLCDNFDYKTNKTTTEEICWDQCECPMGLGFELSNPPGFCQAKYKRSCGNSNKNCVAGLKCQNEECKCPIRDHQHYDTTLEKCITLAGGPCDPKMPNCVQHGTCAKVMDNAEVYHCACHTPYVTTGSGNCTLSLKFGDSCPKEGHICDESAKLYCTDGKCTCKDDLHIYDEDFNKCLGLYGARCSTVDSISCIQHASCNTIEDVEKRRGYHKGLCECNADTILLKDRTCVEKKKYGESCSKETVSEANCDVDSGLKCLDLLGYELFKCDCDPAVAKDNPGKARCDGLVDKPCILGNCVANAKCHELCDNFDYKTNKSTTEEVCWNQCLCPEGLGYVHSKGACLAPPGANCTVSDNCISGFACLGGKCQTKCDETSAIFDAAKNQCVGLVDKNCINNHCVDKAECQFLCDNIEEETFTLPNFYHLNEDICWNQCLCPTGLQASSDGKKCVSA